MPGGHALLVDDGFWKVCLAMGYCLKRGERDPDHGADDRQGARPLSPGEERDDTVTLFKSVPVFWQQQVAPLPSGDPVPLEPPREPLTGDSHAPPAAEAGGVLRVARVLGVVRGDRWARGRLV